MWHVWAEMHSGFYRGKVEGKRLLGRIGVGGV